jgi:hypothetical protein
MLRTCPGLRPGIIVMSDLLCNGLGSWLLGEMSIGKDKGKLWRERISFSCLLLFERRVCLYCWLLVVKGRVMSCINSNKKCCCWDIGHKLIIHSDIMSTNFSIQPSQAKQQHMPFASTVECHWRKDICKCTRAQACLCT